MNWILVQITLIFSLFLGGSTVSAVVPTISTTIDKVSIVDTKPTSITTQVYTVNLDTKTVEVTAPTTVEITPTAQTVTVPIQVAIPIESLVPSGTVNVMKPSYSLEELMPVLYKNAKTKDGYTFDRFWPVVVNNISSTSTNVAWNGPAVNQTEVSFNGTIRLTKDGNEQEIVYEGETYPVHSRTWVHLSNLTPATTYTYQYTYHEDGREDTVIEKSFKTLSQ